MLIGLRGLGLVFLSEILSSDEWSLAKNFGDWSFKVSVQVCRGFEEDNIRGCWGGFPVWFQCGFEIWCRSCNLLLFHSLYVEDTLLLCSVMPNGSFKRVCS